MALNTGKKITWRSWDIIPMLDTVIARVNARSADQPEDLVFTDHQGHPIGDVEIPGVPNDDDDEVVIEDIPPPVMDALEPNPIDIDIELPGVDLVGTQDPPIVTTNDDLNITAPYPTLNDPPLIETVEENDVPDPPDPAPEPVPTPKGVCRSTRVRSAPKRYMPSMSSSCYAYAAAQLEYESVLNPDMHMFTQFDFY